MTWVELLVVIAICLFVFAVLFPVFAPRPHHGNGHGSCASNMKQIGLAMIQYAQDNNNEPPNGTRPTPGLGWVGQIYPYANSVYLFHCPDDEAESKSQSASVVSYAYNSNVPRWFSHQRQTQASPATPTQTVLCFEVAGDQIQTRMTRTAFSPNYPVIPLDEGAAQGATTFSAAGDGTASGLHSTMRGPDPIHYATGDLGGRPGGANNQFNQARHQDGSEFLMADGHVKWFKPGQVSTGTDAPTPSAAQTGAISGTAAGTDNPNYAATFSVK